MAQVCYNEVWLIGCPSSLGSSSSATTHIFCLSRLSHFHLSPLRAHVLRRTPFPGRIGAPPFRAGWRPHIPPFGRVCVCVCNLWSQKVPFGFFPFTAGGVTVDFLVTPMKLWKSTGWKFGRKLPYLLFKLLNSCSLSLLFCLCILPTTQ